jgi:hypothetical protein
LVLAGLVELVDEAAVLAGTRSFELPSAYFSLK